MRTMHEVVLNFLNSDVSEADSTPDSYDPYVHMYLTIERDNDHPSFGKSPIG